MQNIKISIRLVIVYISIMVTGLGIINNIFKINNNDLSNLISLLIIQLISTGYVFYIIKKFYGWKNVGFMQLDKKNFIWFTPYVFILIPMIYKFIEGFFYNISSFDKTTWISIPLIFIGTIVAGFSEEVIFRGVVLNNLRKEISLTSAMFISSLGFSIVHITTIFMGKNLFEMLINVIASSLLGFSFVPLAILLNNIWPMIIFHILWNFILMASNTIGISISKVSLLCNPINIIIAIILWIIVIKNNKKKMFSKRKLRFSENLIDSI